MKRKLPPDSEVWALHACGMKRREIAERFQVGYANVCAALNRWNEKPITPANQTKASTPDKSFVFVGSQPVQHRDTGDGAAAITLEMDGVYRRSMLQIHECADLLKEWGVA